MKESIAIYRTWISKFPKSERLLINAINCALEAGKSEEALTWINKYENNEQRTLKIRQAKARILRGIGDLEGAREIYLELMNNDDAAEESMLEYGQMEYEKGKINEAINIFIKAKLRNPNSTRAISNLITLYREKKDYQKAFKTYEECDEKVRE